MWGSLSTGRPPPCRDSSASSTLLPALFPFVSSVQIPVATWASLCSLLYLWPLDFSPSTKAVLPWQGCFSTGNVSGTHPRWTRNSPQWEVKALLLTGQDVSRSSLGGSLLGCSVVNCRALSYFGNSLANFIIPVI